MKKELENDIFKPSFASWSVAIVACRAEVKLSMVCLREQIP